MNLKRHCVQPFYKVLILLLGKLLLITVHPSFAQETTPAVQGSSRLSTQAELFVRQFILDGMNLVQLQAQVKQRSKEYENNCFFKGNDNVKGNDIQYRLVTDNNRDIKDALIRFYQANETALALACLENSRHGYFDQSICDNPNQTVSEIGEIIQARIKHNRIAIVEINRQMTAEKIQYTKNQITRCYIDNKYINSGAMIPDQEVTGNGIIIMRIIEGWLQDVEVNPKGSESSKLPGGNPPGKLYLSQGYIKRRLLFNDLFYQDQLEHLNMYDLQERLQIMQQDPLFKQIVGKLAPGEELGEGILKVEVLEDDFFELGFRFNNYRHPSVGAYRGAIEMNYHNPLHFLRPGYGLGDNLYLRYGLTQGLKDYSVRYSIPFPLPLVRYDTTLSLGFDKSDSEVITDTFQELGIESDSETWSVSLRHPFYKSYPPALDREHPKAYKEFALAMRLEGRRNTTYLEGEPFSFSHGAINGETEYGVMRLSSEWLSRGQHNVTAFYNTFSFGTDVLGPVTVNEELIDPPGGEKFMDNHFFAWLGQFQWFGRVNQLEQYYFKKIFSEQQLKALKHNWPRVWESSLLFRTNVQLTDRKLLSLEKFSMGGHASVRGYREGALLGDNGYSASLEWHIPLFHLPLGSISKPGEGKIELIPFVDYGTIWNKNDRPTYAPRDEAKRELIKNIASIGIGVQWVPIKNIQAQIYFAHPFTDFEKSQQEEYDLQDSGIHFELSINLLPWK